MDSDALPDEEPLPKTIDVVCIPANGAPIHLRTFKLSEIGSGTIPIDEYNLIEKRLGHIPNMTGAYKLPSFSWLKRQLNGSSERDFDQASLSAYYYVYTCFRESSGLLRNRYLERIQEGMSRIKRPLVYGDAFLFKTNASNVEQRGEYIDMDEDFVKALKDRKMVQLGILQRALICPEEAAGRRVDKGRKRIVMYYQNTKGRREDYFPVDTA